MLEKNFEYNTALVKFIRELNEYEFKFLMYLFNEIYQKHDTNGVMLLSNSLLYEVMGLDEENPISFIILKKTFEKILLLKMQNSVSFFNIIYSIREDMENGFAIIEISPLLKTDFMNVLLVARNSLTKEIISLKSYHSALLYWNVLEALTNEPPTAIKVEYFYTTQKIKELFNVKEDEYLNRSHFNTFQRTRFEKNVIEKSINEVNSLGSRLTIEYIKIKESNKVLGYKFVVKRK